MTFSATSLQDRITEWLGGSQQAEWIAIFIVIGIVSVLAWLLLLLTSRVSKRLHQAIDDQKGSFVRGLTIQRQRIFTTGDAARILHQMVRWSKRIIQVVLVLLFLNLVLSQFEWSREASLAAIQFLGEILAQMFQAVVDFLPNLVIIVLVILLSRMLLHFLRTVFDGISRERIRLPGFYPEWGETSYGLVRIMIIALTIIIIFPYLPGSGSPAFQGLSIFFGVLLSLGSSSAIANVISGVVITYTRAFHIGDRVRIADTEGDVIERSAFVTRICTPKNVEVAIPNSMVMNDHIVNYSAQAQEAGVYLHTTVTIGYDVPWPRVHELLKEAARRTGELETEPEPFVLQTSLDDNYVAYELNAVTRQPSGKSRIYSELHAHILDCFHEAGVEIMSPHYRATRDGNTRALPPATPKGKAGPADSG